MSMIMPMRFSSDDVTAPFHSSAYANAAQGQRLGAVSPQSYAERRKLEQERQHVRHYGQSGLGRMEQIRPFSVPARPAQQSVQQIERSASSRSAPYSFREPPRRHDPYQ